MTTFIVTFEKVLTYHLEVIAEDSQMVSDIAESLFGEIIKPEEKAQIGYWEMTDIDEVK